MKFKFLVVIAFVIGFSGGYIWRGWPLQSIHAEGELQYEKPQSPAVTPTYPPGYYVLSRIYLSGATEKMLGKRVYATGVLSIHDHPETPTYPLIHDRNIIVSAK